MGKVGAKYMKIKMRKKGTREWNERELDLLDDEFPDEFTVESSVCEFAEERGLDEGDIVEVFRRGKYEIIVWEEPQYEAVKL